MVLFLYRAVCRKEYNNIGANSVKLKSNRYSKLQFCFEMTLDQ